MTNDNSCKCKHPISTTDARTAIMCQRCHRLYLPPMPVCDCYDPDLTTITIEVREPTAEELRDCPSA